MIAQLEYPNFDYSDKLATSTYHETIRFKLSENRKSVQKTDDPASHLVHLIRSLQRLPRDRWQEMMDQTAGSFATSNQEIRRIAENINKVKLLVKLFGYPHFESYSAILNPTFFNKGARVYSPVSA